MKVRAFILFICAAIYIVETSSVGYKNCLSPVNAVSTNNDDMPACCAGKMKCMKQQRKRSSSQKDNAGNCGNTANCINCPICYTAIFPVNDLPVNISSLYRKQYPVIQSDYNSSYFAKSWKPPNAFSFI
jgi:hypothetical protein